VKIQSEDLKVGDIVLNEDGDNFPADILLLSSSNDGDSFIKTS
jgi:magnesium-transporting ATPase (P-type)